MQRKFSLIRLGFSGFLFSLSIEMLPRTTFFHLAKTRLFFFSGNDSSCRLRGVTLPATRTQEDLLYQVANLHLETWHFGLHRGTLHMSLGVGHLANLHLGTWHYTGAPCTLSTCSLADTLHMAPFTLYLAPCIWFLAHDPRRGAPCQTEPWHLAFWSTLCRWEKEVTQELE